MICPAQQQLEEENAQLRDENSRLLKRISGENSNESPDFKQGGRFSFESDTKDYLTDLEFYKQQSEELTNKLDEANYRIQEHNK